MTVQWPLVIFTLFLCITSGILGGISIMALQNKGENVRRKAIIASAITLVAGGIASFMHLQHWERIFNGFGHITSGITQELIGVVVLAVLIIIWFIFIQSKKKIGRALPIVTLICAIGMIVVTGHSYLMEGRPGWNIGLLLFYLGNGCLWGGLAVWLLEAISEGSDFKADDVKIAFWGTLIQLICEVLYIPFLASAHIADFGYYANVYSMTTTPLHIDSLATYAVAGPGALMFWISIVATLIVLACTIAAKRKAGSNKVLLTVAIICAIVASITFRVLLYQVGFSLTVIY